MPQQIDLVVNNGAAVAKTFSAITPAGGDGQPALWQLKEGTISTVFPSLEASARPNAGRSARKAIFTLKVPSSYTAPVTGLTAVGSSATVNMTVTVPSDFPEALKADFVAYWTNLMQNTLVKSLIKDALAAT